LLKSLAYSRVNLWFNLLCPYLVLPVLRWSSEFPWESPLPSPSPWRFSGPSRVFYGCGTWPFLVLRYATYSYYYENPPCEAPRHGYLHHVDIFPHVYQGLTYLPTTWCTESYFPRSYPQPSFTKGCTIHSEWFRTLSVIRY
jgi:hypothetical protein